jgi:RHS repeat-associated protein
MEHGANLYDFEARTYDPATGRFLSIDPLAEKRPWESPYSYCGNNPVNRIDPTGMIWDDPQQAQHLKNDINDKKNKLNEGIVSRQEKLKREDISIEQINDINCEITALNDRISKLDESIANIDLLGNDKENIYVISKNESSVGDVTKKEDGKISINAGTTGLIMHEIEHVSQSLNTGGLEFDSKTNKLQYPKPDVGTQINAEMKAYQVQFSYNGYFPNGVSFWSPKDITPQMTGNITSGGKILYIDIYNRYNKNNK